jgi:hypothetical protein
MPKPIKKATPAKKRASSDPMIRARQLMEQHMEKAGAGRYAAPMPDSPTPAAPSFQEQYKAHMAKLGAKGGKASGAKRMDMPAKQRRDIAMKAAKARWAKKNRPAQS